MKILLLAAVIFFGSMTPAKYDEGFEITAPAGWEKTKTTYQGVEVVFILSPLKDSMDDFRENVNVVTEKTYEYGMKEYLKFSIDNMEKQLPGFVQGKTREKKINGLDFTCMRYTHVYEGMTIDAEVCICLKDGTGYVITCSSKGGQFNEWENVFGEIVGSFRVV